MTVGRNEEYLMIAVGHTQTVVKAAIVLRFFPEFLKRYMPPEIRIDVRFIVLFFRSLRRDRKTFQSLLEPVIEERRELIAQHGSDYKKPVHRNSTSIDLERHTSVADRRSSSI